MEKRLNDAAARIGVKVETETSTSSTGTDANSLQWARNGVPTALLSVPLSYMHTTVETISEKTVAETGRLLAAFLRGVGPDWGEWLCLDD
jgi:endoglucanase